MKHFIFMILAVLTFLVSMPSANEVQANAPPGINLSLDNPTFDVFTFTLPDSPAICYAEYQQSIFEPYLDDAYMYHNSLVTPTDLLVTQIICYPLKTYGYTPLCYNYCVNTWNIAFEQATRNVPGVFKGAYKGGPGVLCNTSCI